MTKKSWLDTAAWPWFVGTMVVWAVILVVMMIYSS